MEEITYLAGQSHVWLAKVRIIVLSESNEVPDADEYAPGTQDMHVVVPAIMRRETL